MAVGASQPTVVASKDGRIGMKNQMQVKEKIGHMIYLWEYIRACIFAIFKMILGDPSH